METTTTNELASAVRTAVAVLRGRGMASVAEDAAQEGALRWLARGGDRPVSAVVTYARHAGIDMLRRWRPMDAALVVAADLEPWEVLAAREQPSARSRAAAVLRTVSRADARRLRLAYLAGPSSYGGCLRIAAAEGVSPCYARCLLSRARARARTAAS